MATARTAVIKIKPQQAALFVCDLQERFATAIHQWDNVVATAHKMLKAAKVLGIPVYTTEQAPKGQSVGAIEGNVTSSCHLTSMAHYSTGIDGGTSQIPTPFSCHRQDSI